MPLFTQLKKPVYLLAAIGTAFIVFDINYYFMKNLPGTRDLMCVDGGGYTPENIIFSLVLSVLTGILVAGFMGVFSMKAEEKNIQLTSLSGVGLLLGMLTVFCPLCTLPVVSVFGFSLWAFFTENEIIFKILSLVLMLIPLYLLNQQLKKECVICEVPIGSRKKAKV